MWLLCNLNKPYDLSHFQSAAQKLGVELQIIDQTKLQILNNGEIKLFYNQSEISPPKYLLNWNGCMNMDLERQIESALIKCGTIICNSLAEINHWQDKFRWQVETSLPVAKSLKLDSSRLDDSIDLIEANFTYPFIIKSDIGSLGKGIYKVANRTNFKQISEIINLLDKSFKVHIEEFIDYQHDLRMYVIGDTYYLMERIATDDFRANIAQNAVSSSYLKTELTEQIFQQVRKLYKSVVFGVDILITKDSYIICEINSAPGFTGIEQVNNIDIAEEIIKAIYL